MSLQFWMELLRDWGIALLIAVGIFVGWNLLGSWGPLTEGDAPDIQVVDLDGNPVTLADARGQTVVLNFWATWCGPCVYEIPHLVKFQEAHPDVPIWGVSIDKNKSAEALAAFGRRKHINYRLLHDPKHVAASAFDVSSYPTTIVIDPEGHIQSASVGTITKSRLETMVFEEHHQH